MKDFLKLLFNDVKLYEKFKSDFTYHSSAIEGSTISKKDNARLVNENTTISVKDEINKYSKDEVLENIGLGKVFDIMIKNLNTDFSIEEIKQ